MPINTPLNVSDSCKPFNTDSWVETDAFSPTGNMFLMIQDWAEPSVQIQIYGTYNSMDSEKATDDPSATWELVGEFSSASTTDERFFGTPHVRMKVRFKGTGVFSVIDTPVTPVTDAGGGAGAALPIGQKTSAESVSFVISSDHPALPVMVGPGVGKNVNFTCPANSAAAPVAITLADTKKITITNPSDYTMAVSFPQEQGDASDVFDAILPRSTRPYFVSGVTTMNVKMLDAVATSVSGFARLEA